MSSDPWPDPKEWASLEECIQHVMKSRGCSRRTARRIVTGHIKRKEIETKFVRGPSPFVRATPAEVAKKLDAGEDDSLLITLAEFMRFFKMTWEETQAELVAGRLAMGATESVILERELNNSIDPRQWACTVADVLEWVANPKTPAEFSERATRSKSQ